MQSGQRLLLYSLISLSPFGPKDFLRGLLCGPKILPDVLFFFCHQVKESKHCPVGNMARKIRGWVS